LPINMRNLLSTEYQCLRAQMRRRRYCILQHAPVSFIVTALQNALLQPEGLDPWHATLLQGLPLTIQPTVTGRSGSENINFVVTSMTDEQKKALQSLAPSYLTFGLAQIGALFRRRNDRSFGMMSSISLYLDSVKPDDTINTAAKSVHQLGYKALSSCLLRTYPNDSDHCCFSRAANATQSMNGHEVLMTISAQLQVRSDRNAIESLRKHVDIQLARRLDDFPAVAARVRVPAQGQYLLLCLRQHRFRIVINNCFRCHPLNQA